MPFESDPPSSPSIEPEGERPLTLPVLEEGTAETAGPPAGGVQFRLPAFEGPLDLLLHLIRVNRIDITDIPILEITRQYNQTLDLMRELNLEVAGEYLVMAATLLHIKSRMLLPPDPDSRIPSPEDPRSVLVRQLEDYERFRMVSRRLGEAEGEFLRTWVRPRSLVSQFEGEAMVVADLFSLLTAFRRMLENLEKQEQVALRRERISLLDRIRWLLDRLATDRRASFTSLFEGSASRSELIVTFLALLELIRLQVVGAVQTERFGEIDILLLESPDAVTLDAEKILDV